MVWHKGWEGVVVGMVLQEVVWHIQVSAETRIQNWGSNVPAQHEKWTANYS